MRSILFIFLVFAVLSCNKQKAAEFSGAYDCSCTHKFIIPGSSNFAVHYQTTLEFIQEKAKLTIGDWTFSVRKLDQLDSYEEELEDGTLYTVDFDENRVTYSKVSPTVDGTSKTDCEGTKVQ